MPVNMLIRKSNDVFALSLRHIILKSGDGHLEEQYTIALGIFLGAGLLSSMVFILVGIVVYYIPGKMPRGRLLMRRGGTVAAVTIFAGATINVFSVWSNAQITVPVFLRYLLFCFFPVGLLLFWKLYSQKR